MNCFSSVLANYECLPTLKEEKEPNLSPRYVRDHVGWKRATATTQNFVRLSYAWQFNMSAYMEECVVRKNVLENTKYPSSSLSLDIN